MPQAIAGCRARPERRRPGRSRTRSRAGGRRRRRPATRQARRGDAERGSRRRRTRRSAAPAPGADEGLGAIAACASSAACRGGAGRARGRARGAASARRADAPARPSSSASSPKRTSTSTPGRPRRASRRCSTMRYADETRPRAGAPRGRGLVRVPSSSTSSTPSRTSPASRCASASATMRSSRRSPARRPARDGRSSGPASASSCTAARCGRRHAATAPRPSSLPVPGRYEVPVRRRETVLARPRGARRAARRASPARTRSGSRPGSSWAASLPVAPRHPAMAWGTASAAVLVTAPGTVCLGAEALIGAHCFAAARYSDRRGAVVGLVALGGCEPRAGRWLAERQPRPLSSCWPAPAWLPGPRGARARGRGRRAGRAGAGAR